MRRVGIEVLPLGQILQWTDGGTSTLQNVLQVKSRTISFRRF
jgi:hypothetical protein